MTDELKKCPFCGGEANIGHNIHDSNSETAKLNGQTTFYFVNCAICGANNLAINIGFKERKEAINHWNTRN